MANLGKCGAIAYLTRLLSFVPIADAVTVAGRLVARFGNIDSVVGATVEELTSVEGVDLPAAMLLRVTGALASRSVTEGFELGRVHTEQEITEYLVGLYIGVSRETVHILILDENDCITAVENMGEGTVGASEVYPRRLLEIAVKNKAKSVILAHNHPHGGASPSEDDVTATRKLVTLFSNAGIELTVHYVVAGRSIEPVIIEE